MLEELTRKQRELHDLAASFQRLRSFHRELQRCTKGKSFPVASELAWDAVVSLRRMLVIDLSEWVGSIHAEWLQNVLQGEALTKLRTSKRTGLKLASQAHVIAPDNVVGPIRAHLAEGMREARRDAIRRLFGARAAAEGGATHADVLRLAKRLERWAANLKGVRNRAAHRYGRPRAAVKALRLPDLARRFEFCGRLLNDLRLLAASDHYVMPHLEASTNDPNSRDLVDLIVVGTIEYAVQQWTGAEPRPYLGKLRDDYWRRKRSGGTVTRTSARK